LDLILIRDLRPGLFPHDRSCDLGNDAPLETATNRSAPMGCGPTLDQARPARGAAALRVADLARQGRPPPAAPDKRAPPSNRLARGSPVARLPEGEGRSLQRRELDVRRLGGGIRTQRRAASSSRVETVNGSDLRFSHAGGDRWCPPRTSGSRCCADPARTSIPTEWQAADQKSRRRSLGTRDTACPDSPAQSASDAGEACSEPNGACLGAWTLACSLGKCRLVGPTMRFLRGAVTRTSTQRDAKRSSHSRGGGAAAGDLVVVSDRTVACRAAKTARELLDGVRDGPQVSVVTAGATDQRRTGQRACCS
jgi:hypothetical protein